MKGTRPFSKTIYAPNILYTVVENRCELWKEIKVGDQVRLPNVPGSCSICVWPKERTESGRNFYMIPNYANGLFVAKCLDQIIVEFDEDFVRQTLIDNEEYQLEKANAIMDVCKGNIERFKKMEL
jgi:hypothetical protein